MHFEKDRLNFGLYGLYPKYRCYIKPLSYLFLLLGNQLVCKRLDQEQGMHFFRVEVDAGLGAVDDFLKPTQELKKKELQH